MCRAPTARWRITQAESDPQTNQGSRPSSYLACTALVDDLVGQIVGALEESPYADNTIIVLWSDHGFQLGRRAAGDIRSGSEPPGSTSCGWCRGYHPGHEEFEPVNLLDIYPTLASLTGSEPPELEGKDLTLMKDPKPIGTRPR